MSIYLQKSLSICVCITILLFNHVKTTVLYPRSSTTYHSGFKHYGYPVKLVKVTNTVAVPVPYPVPVTRKVPYPVTVTKPVPYPVPHPVPVQVTKPVVIQQAVPVPVVKPVVIRQPVFNHGYFSPFHQYANDYFGYLKNHAGYYPNNVPPLHPYYQNNNIHNGDGSDEHHELNNEAHNLGGGQFEAGYGGHSGQGYMIPPPPMAPEYGSSEVPSNEQEGAENENVNSQEMYPQLADQNRPTSSLEMEGNISSPEDTDASNLSLQHRTY